MNPLVEVPAAGAAAAAGLPPESLDVMLWPSTTGSPGTQQQWLSVSWSPVQWRVVAYLSMHRCPPAVPSLPINRQA